MKKISTKTLTLGAVFTALVIVLQLLGTYTAFFGPFSTAVALIPIVIGAAICGKAIGAWLGFVFGVVVLVSGGANLFLPYSFIGTVVTVLVKGIACGFGAGIVYQLLKKISTFWAVFISAIVCPVVNTGVFLLGCAVFFLKDASAIAVNVGLSEETGMQVFLALAMMNFIFELGANMVLSPVTVRILDIKKKDRG